MEEIFIFDDNNLAAEICGERDRFLRQIESRLRLTLSARGNQINIQGSEVGVVRAMRTLEHLRQLAAAGVRLTPLSVNYALSVCDEDDPKLASLLTRTVFTTPRGRAIKAKSFGQWQYLQAIEEKDLVFAIGPAGTGKTFLAVLKAVEAFRKKQVNRLVLARPAVEAGEKLGFLPGDLQEKVNPYLRPVYDALDDALGLDQARRLMEKGNIEVVPLAYMRGRTLDDAFIILDEAQNTTSQQMKMFLTRIGMGSRAVVTGDVTQTDLPSGAVSGLVEAEQRLRHVDGLAFCYLSKVDVVRHPLVQRIIEAYEENEGGS